MNIKAANEREFWDKTNESNKDLGSFFKDKKLK